MRVRSDEQLARNAAAGDDKAFAAIYARHHDALYRYCLTIVRDPDDARDVLQSVMANALAALRKAPPDAPLRPWLFRITHNEAISALRKRRPAAELRDDAVSADLEVTVEQRARLRQLVADLRALPERQRGALVMRELSGLSHAEIAAALGISTPQAKQAILEARVSLQEAEKGRAMQCPDVRSVISAQDGRRLRARSVRAHLRACDDCRALRDAIATRQADLRVLAPPVPAALSAGLLGHLLGGSGSSFAAKAAVGAAVVATAGGGVAVTTAVRDHDVPRHAERRTAASAAAAAATAVPATAAGATDPATGRPTAAGEGTRTRMIARVSDRRRDARRPRQRATEATPTPTPTPGTAVANGRPDKEAKGQQKAKPGKRAKPVKTPKPAKAPKPVKTAKPVRTARPAQTPRPVRTPKPEPTATPAPTVTPVVTVEPDAKVRPDEK